MPIIVCSNDDPIDLFYGNVNFFKNRFFYKKKVKTVDFSETIAACGLKVGRCRQQMEFMKVCEYSKSRSFFTLAKGHLHMKIKTCFSQKPLVFSESKFVCRLLVTWK